MKAVVECFFEVNGLSCLNFKRICTDGAPEMVGANGGFVTLVKNKWKWGKNTLDFIYHTKVQWFSRGKCLFWLNELKGEVETCFLENENNFHVEFRNTEFDIKLAYLADVFDHLNEMNVCLQGCDVIVRGVQEKLASFLLECMFGRHE